MAAKRTKSTGGESGNDKAAKLAAEIAKLCAENERLKTDREILKKALGLEPVRLKDVYELISSLSRTYKTNYLCALFEVSKTAYYGTGHPALPSREEPQRR